VTSESSGGPPVSAADDTKPARPPRASRQTRRERRARPSGPSRLIETTGPDPATPLSEVRLVVGTIIGTHGIHGELKVLLTTDEPDHLKSITRVYVGEAQQPRRVLGIRFHDRFALMRLKGIGTPETGLEFRGQQVRIAGTDARPLAPGEFYLYQLIGLSVVDESGQPLGTVTDIMETGANDVLVVAPADGSKDQLYPNHPDVVLDIKPEEGRVVVRPMVYWE
jgi:16S rRNA processing protein RimM